MLGELHGGAGAVPYALAAGGTKWRRGYYEGRYRDLNATLLQTELRFALYQQLGGVVFGRVGALGDAQTLLRVQQPKGDYGAGLRFAVN